MKKLFTFILISFLFLSTAHAQFKVYGKIISNDNGAMEFVNVLLMNNTDSSLVKGSVTDTTGHYTFNNVDPGAYFIKASMIGFGSGQSEVFQFVENADIEISPINLAGGVELDEVIVSTTKPFIEMKADKVVVNVANSSAAAGNNALEVLQMSPGVAVDKDNNISLRGKQGVLVTIDGKNQYMSSADIARLLESMPASNIESIEIIQNPSAKYDAEGNSGIINIKLKKAENLGYNGNLSLSARQGRYSNYNGSLALNYRSAKMNVYGNLSNNHWQGFNDINLMRDIPFDGMSTLFEQKTLFRWNGESRDIKAGVDYALGDKTTLGLLTKLNYGTKEESNDNLTNISGGNAPDFNRLNVNSRSDGDWNQKTFNTNLKHEFGEKGGSIIFDIDYSEYRNPALVIYNNTYSNTENSTIIDPASLRNATDVSVDIFASKIDYSKTIGKVNFETGLKFSSVKTDNETIFEDLFDGDWINNADRSNQFLYTEDIYAAYVDGAAQLGKINIKAGLRLEHTNSVGNSMTLDQIVDRSYTNLFPSISLNHSIGEKHSLSYSFSRRLNRPNYKNLNPFINYLDDFTFEKGNPFLQPQYSNSYGINYGFGRSLFVSANYSKTTEAMTEIIEQFSDQNTTFQTIQNLDDFESVSLNITAPLNLTTFWTTRVSATAFYHKFNSVIPSGVLDNEQTSYNLYIGNDLNISKKWRGEVIFNYRSALIWGLFEIEPQYNLDLGISTRIMQGNGTLKLGVNDLFRTLRNRVEVNQDDINLRVNQLRDTRRVSLSFSYKFGNQKVQAARRRRTATEDEAGRISRNNG